MAEISEKDSPLLKDLETFETSRSTSSDTLAESHQSFIKDIETATTPRWQESPQRQGCHVWLYRKVPAIILACLAISTLVLLHQRAGLQAQVNEFRHGAATTPTSRHGVTTDSTSRLVDVLRTAYDPIAVDEPAFISPEGIVYELNQTLTAKAEMSSLDVNIPWKESLGSDVLILDMDSRSFDGKNQMVHDGLVSWDTFEGYSTGMLSHYSYALLHGYDYKFVSFPTPEDRFASWLKPSIISSFLRQYRFVVFLDNDCIFHNPKVPLEWLLNYWNISPTTSLAMPLDPPDPQNADPRGRTNVNTGFIIAQKLPRTFDILDAWNSCPDNGTDGTPNFPGCAHWVDHWPMDQGAFSQYIRYTFPKPDDLRELPCDEANGYPESRTVCRGRFIRHYWIYKELLKDGVAEVVMNAAIQGLRGEFMRNLASTFAEWKGGNQI